MSFDNQNTKNSTAVIRAACAIIFCLFSFVYLYYYQADILAMAQHVLSDGTRHYDRMIGAVIITSVLLFLQLGMYVLFRLNNKYHALTYFPSLLILTVMTDVSPNIDKGFRLGAWLWVFPLVLVLWIGAACILRNYQLLERSNAGGLLSRDMWKNMLVMIVMLFLVGMVSNNDSVFHYRMRVERYMLAHDYENAIIVGRKSLETDSSLTMLRVYALARTGNLGDALFTYPLVGSSNDIIPDMTGARCMMYPNDSIYKFLGAKPGRKMKTQTFLKMVIDKGLATPAVRDYVLCGYLIDRDLDAFVRALPIFYDVDDKLPKHYREALTLYNHLRSNPYIIYHDDVMDTDFQDLQSLEKQYQARSAREVAVREHYDGTYWFYYEYGKRH